jgi:hypothetical protein
MVSTSVFVANDNAFCRLASLVMPEDGTMLIVSQTFLSWGQSIVRPRYTCYKTTTFFKGWLLRIHQHVSSIF